MNSYAHDLMEDKPKLAELVAQVRTNKWYSLGLQLQLEDNDLEAIRLDFHNIEDRRREMFRKWLRTVPDASRKQLLAALKTEAVAENRMAHEYEEFVHNIISYSAQSLLSRDEELQQVQKNLLSALPKKKEFRPLEKFNQHYDTILEIFSSHPEIIPDIVAKLTAIRLIDSAERDQAKRITCESIRIRALMKAVGAMVKRAAEKEKQLKNFFGVLAPYEYFDHIIQDLNESGYDVPVGEIVTKTDEIISQTSHDGEVKTAETQLTTDVHKYAECLRARYTKMKAKPSGWPDVRNWRFIDLAISNSDQTIAQLTANGNSKKTDHKLINLHELVNISTRILVKGAPGIGKSSLAIELCKKWSKGDLGSHFKLVILLRLRVPKVQKAKKIEDLIMPERYRNCIESLGDCLGEGVLFILEGYDELPDEQRESNWLQTLMEEIEEQLPKASVMVTSRPWATLGISEFFQEHVQILGFTESSRREYVDSVLSSDADVFEQELLTVSSIKSCLHVPLYLVSLVEIYKQNGEISKTVTQLYSAFIHTQLMRFFFRHKQQEYLSVPSGEFFKFPKDIYLAFLKICEVAYEASITGSPLQLSDSSETPYQLLDLLQEDPHNDIESGISPCYSFLHSSVQDFLAAYYISRKEPDDIKQHIQEMECSTKSNQFSLIIEFLSGLGKNCQLEGITIPVKVRRFDTFRQLCETQDDRLIKDCLKSSVARTIHRTFPLPTPRDFWCLGKCIALSQCIWQLGFTFRQLHSEHLLMLCNGIKSVENSQGQIKELNLSLNELDIEGLNHLFNLPPHCLSTLELINLRGNHINVLPIPQRSVLSRLQRFYFHDNEIVYNGHRLLIQALKNEAKVVRHVSFSNLSHEECALLLTISTLETIELWQICRDSVKAVVSAIVGNTVLKNLRIHQSEVDCIDVDELPKSLPTTKIELLTFSNCAIDDNAAEIIAQAVTNSESLQKLDLSDNSVSCNGNHALLKLFQASRLLSEFNLEHNPIYKCNQCVQGLTMTTKPPRKNL